MVSIIYTAFERCFMFIFAENERNRTNNFVQVWNNLVDYDARSEYGEYEKIERPLEEPNDASNWPVS